MALGGGTRLCPGRWGPAVLVATTPRGARCLLAGAATVSVAGPLPWGGERCPVVGFKNGSDESQKPSLSCWFPGTPLRHNGSSY